MKNLILPVFIYLSLSGLSQEPVLEKDVREQLKRNASDWGPNTRHFWSDHIGFGVILPINRNDSMSIRDGMQSKHIHIGWRYKLKLNSTFSLGADIAYQRQQYRIAQSKDKSIFSGGKEFENQKLIFNGIGGGFFFRINFDKRGNRLGRYLDLAGEMNYIFAEKLSSKEKTDPAVSGGSEVVITNQTNLDYTKEIQAFGVVRFGWDRIAIFGKYRLSDIFNRSENFYQNQTIPELPLISVGLEWSHWNVPYSTQR